MRALFITGTDTGIGKTIVSAIFVAHALRHGSAAYHKPVQTGIESDCDASVVKSLFAKNALLKADYGLGLLRPLAPNWSAYYQNVVIDFDNIVKKSRASCTADITIIEGAGGVLCPITEKHSMADLIACLKIPAVLVARSSLGTINHTLLSLEALRKRNIPLAGIVMVGKPNNDNLSSIRIIGAMPLIMSIPLLPSIDSKNIEDIALAKEDQLKRFFA